MTVSTQHTYATLPRQAIKHLLTNGF